MLELLARRRGPDRVALEVLRAATRGTRPQRRLIVAGMGEHTHPVGREIAASSAPDDRAIEELDLRGEVCPYTFLKARLALESLPADMVLRVVVDNETSARDVPRSLVGAGHLVLEVVVAGDGTWSILTRRIPG